MLFAGWAFAATFLPRLADVYGRKVVYLVSMIGHGTLFGAIVLSRSRILTTVLMFLLGMFSVGRASVGYLYMLELSPVKQQATIGTMLQLCNTLVTILATVYFYAISKEWVWFETCGVALNFIVVGCIYFLPESPKYLYAQKRWDDLRYSLNQIGRANGKVEFRGLFISEVNQGGEEDK